MMLMMVDKTSWMTTVRSVDKDVGKVKTVGQVGLSEEGRWAGRLSMLLSVTTTMSRRPRR